MRASFLNESRLLPVAFAFGTFGAFLVLVEALLSQGYLNRFIIPLPSEVLSAFQQLLVEGEILVPARETAFEMAVAGGLVVLIGVPAGSILYWFEPVRRAVENWVAALAAAPLVLAFPLFLAMFGRSSTTVIVMSVLTGIAPVVLKTCEGLVGTRPVLVDVGRSLNLSDRQMFTRIVLPAALPVIFSGVRLSWTFVMVSVVGVEFLTNLGGLGQLINEKAERFDLPGTYGAIAIVLMLSVLFVSLLELAEKWLRRGK